MKECKRHKWRVGAKTKIVFIQHKYVDKTQTRSTIPKDFVDEHNVTKEDSMEWESKDGKLKGELKKK